MDESVDKRDLPADLPGSIDYANNNVEKTAGKGHVEDSLAANYVDPSLRLDEEQNRRLVRRIHRHLLPVMCLAYIIQALDKGTLGTSSIMGWLDDVHAKGQDYALTSTFLWAGVIVGEPIVNQLIRKVPAAKVLGGAMVIWSALIFALGFTENIPGVWAIRFFLGLLEAAFAPCLVAITVQWYRKEEQAMITTYWQAAFGVAGVISGLLGYGFIHVDNATHKIHGWQWVHVIVGILSFVSSITLLLVLPDAPTKARWATEDEKVKFVERVRVNDQGIQAKKWKPSQVKEAFTDPLVGLLVLMIFSQTLINGGLYTFNSLLINKAFGFNAATAQLLGIPLAIFQVLLYLLIGWLVTKTQQTIYCLIGYTLVSVVGTIVLLTVTPSDHTRGGLLVAFYAMQCVQAMNPSMYSLLSRNVAGQTKKSIVYSLFFVAWAGGNAIGPQLFQSVWKPRYFNTLYIHLGLYGLFVCVLLTMRWVCIRRNAKREALLVGENLHVQAFEDKTDLENVEFRYSY